MSYGLQLSLGFAAISIAMFILWLIQTRTRNANSVDVAWGAGVGVMGLFLALTSEGVESRRILLALVSGAWSLRLTAYLVRDRILSHGEDGRYARLRESWGLDANRNFFLFFQFQAVLVVILSVPLMMVAHSEAPLSLLDWAGCILGLTAVLGESVADMQLAAFRRNPANRGRTCRSGLWRYSRHPNYFFEWLHWWAYVLLAAGSPGWWITLTGPALMLFFIFKVTGIPATEARALATRGEDYRRYQESTSQFVPWFPKKEN